MQIEHCGCRVAFQCILIFAVRLECLSIQIFNIYRFFNELCPVASRALRHKLPLGFTFFRLFGDQFHGHVDKLVVPVADQHARSAAHTGMDAVASQKVAKYAIIGIGRKTPDHVTRIDIFYGDIDAFACKISADGVL